MLEFVAEYWNDAMTVASFTLAVIITYYQIRHYRAQRPLIEIADIEDPKYSVRTRDEDWRDLGVAQHLETDDLVDSYYTADVTVENRGREEVTISKGKLHVSDTGEQLPMLNSQGRRGLTAESVRVGAVDTQRISLRAIGDVRDDGHPSQVECRIMLRSPAGDVSETVTFDRRN